MQRHILSLLEEWHPQFLTVQELALLVPGSPTTATIRKHVQRLLRLGLVEVQRPSSGPHRIFFVLKS